MTSKFVPDWLATNKTLEKFDKFVFSNDYIDFGDINSHTFTFFSDDMGLVAIELKNFNLDYDGNFDENDFETIIHVRLMVCWNR